jgi:hypothetical protein
VLEECRRATKQAGLHSQGFTDSHPFGHESRKSKKGTAEPFLRWEHPFSSQRTAAPSWRAVERGSPRVETGRRLHQTRYDGKDEEGPNSRTRKKAVDYTLVSWRATRVKRIKMFSFLVTMQGFSRLVHEICWRGYSAAFPTYQKMGWTLTQIYIISELQNRL